MIFLGFNLKYLYKEQIIISLFVDIKITSQVRITTITIIYIFHHKIIISIIIYKIKNKVNNSNL